MDPIMAVASQAQAGRDRGCRAVDHQRHTRAARPAASGPAGVSVSFPSKNLGGIGDGGMVRDQRSEMLYKRLLIMRNHGMEPSTITSASAATSGWTRSRRRRCWSNCRIWKVVGKHGGRTRTTTRGSWLKEAWSERRGSARTAIRSTTSMSSGCRRRDAVAGTSEANHIGCEIYYPGADASAGMFCVAGLKRGDFPHSEKAADEVLALPVYPELTDAMKDYVVRDDS